MTSSSSGMATWSFVALDGVEVRAPDGDKKDTSRKSAELCMPRRQSTHHSEPCLTSRNCLKFVSESSGRPTEYNTDIRATSDAISSTHTLRTSPSLNAGMSRLCLCSCTYSKTSSFSFSSPPSSAGRSSSTFGLRTGESKVITAPTPAMPTARLATKSSAALAGADAVVAAPSLILAAKRATNAWRFSKRFWRSSAKCASSARSSFSEEPRSRKASGNCTVEAAIDSTTGWARISIYA
mmetsp:Transcript_6802/g.11962  ORF Transcript_6802/g.11962 Transcript_6802/m.11962 type:complete len:238 (-) Transcript_6802:5-718(-)